MRKRIGGGTNGAATYYANGVATYYASGVGVRDALNCRAVCTAMGEPLNNKMVSPGMLFPKILWQPV